jgi:dTDP-4-dehydrorhamnose reductase
MTIGLIGHTGFVGTNLSKQFFFDKKYNSSNIREIEGEQFDLLICAAPSAVKWKINNDPIPDLCNISTIVNHLSKVKFKKMILISSIDVYGGEISKGFDERCSPPIDQHYYGFNRYIAERYFSSLGDCSILRLPGLFGTGLKKNIIFDLINDNMLEKISLKTKLQWFDINKIKDQIDFILESNIRLLNVAPEPISTFEIVSDLFSEKLSKCKGLSDINYDVRTKYYNKYSYCKDQIKQDLFNFIKGNE